MAGSRFVHLRTILTATHDEIRRMQYTYGNGVVISLNRTYSARLDAPGGVT
jgi:hypothetical protein